MVVSKYYTFEGKSFIEAATYDEVLYKLKRANDEVCELTNKLEKVEAENKSLMDSHIKLYNDTKDEIRILKESNQALRYRLQNMIDICDGSCFDNYEDLPLENDEDKKDKLITKLQDQHQQDCIKINQLHVTIDTLVDKYSRFRKTVRMD